MLYFEFFVVLALIGLNGFFAMSELAIVSSKRSRLAKLASEGNRGAARAVALLDDPTGFLSTVQVGITLIGIVAGAYSGATFALPLAGLLSDVFASPQTAQLVAFTIVVAVTTYLSLIIGELVPKRIALANAERIASFVSGPMTILARIGTPIVWLLRLSTNLVLRLLGLHNVGDQAVTEEDIRALIGEGASAGVIEPDEKAMIDAVMRMADRQVRTIMVPRPDIEWISVDEGHKKVLQRMRTLGHSRYLLCRGTIDDVVGVLHVRDMLEAAASTRFSLEAAAREPLYVNETMPIMRLLDRFRSAPVHMAVVLDEYGSVEGIVTPADVLAALAGEFPQVGEAAEPEAVQREDGSWLLDGAMTVDDALAILDGVKLEADYDFVTLAGFVLDRLAHLPMVGETFEHQGWRFEIIDMDGRRIDKILATRLPNPSGTT